MRRIDRLRGTPAATEKRFDLSGLAALIDQANTSGGVVQSWSQNTAQKIEQSYSGYAQGLLRSDGVVFAVMLSRLMLFTEARFQWQTINKGRPGGLFGTPSLAVLEKPWTNGTTGDLLARMEQDATTAGNFFGVRTPSGITRLRPDWVQIIVGSKSGDPADLDAHPIGYVYCPPQRKPVTLLPADVAHYAPVPDPDAAFRGMSWLTPVVREVQADMSATAHKLKFFENAATPNMAVSLDKAVTVEQFRQFVREMSEEHDGAENAYKTLYLAGGADVTVIGADMKQLDFKVTQGAGETRICAAGGVPPIIVGLSEGLASATYSNYGMARRKFGDHWARPSWRQAAAALESIVPPPAPATRLWYDDRDIAFLQEDRKDDAEIAQFQATTIRQYVEAGFEPSSVVDAVDSGDLSKLQHSGLYSKQLQPAGPVPPAGAVPPAA